MATPSWAAPSCRARPRRSRSRPTPTPSPTGRGVETAEQLGGYYEVSTDDLDDLMDVCKILSATGDAVEVHRKITGGRVVKYLVLLIGRR